MHTPAIITPAPAAPAPAAIAAVGEQMSTKGQGPGKRVGLSFLAQLQTELDERQSPETSTVAAQVNRTEPALDGGEEEADPQSLFALTGISDGLFVDVQAGRRNDGPLTGASGQETAQAQGQDLAMMSSRVDPQPQVVAGAENSPARSVADPPRVETEPAIVVAGLPEGQATITVPPSAVGEETQEPAHQIAAETTTTEGKPAVRANAFGGPITPGRPDGYVKPQRRDHEVDVAAIRPTLARPIEQTTSLSGGGGGLKPEADNLAATTPGGAAYGTVPLFTAESTAHGNAAAPTLGEQAVPSEPASGNDLVEQVVARARAFTNGSVRSVEVQLKPEALGRVTLRVSDDGKGALQARIVVERQDVALAIRTQLSELVRGLGAQGLKVGRIDIVGPGQSGLDAHSQGQPDLGRHEAGGQWSGAFAEHGNGHGGDPRNAGPAVPAPGWLHRPEPAAVVSTNRTAHGSQTAYRLNLVA